MLQYIAVCCYFAPYLNLELMQTESAQHLYTSDKKAPAFVFSHSVILFFLSGVNFHFNIPLIVIDFAVTSWDWTVFL